MQTTVVERISLTPDNIYGRLGARGFGSVRPLVSRDSQALAVLGVLASGGGSNLQAIIDAIERGDLPARIGVVISNRSSAGALDRARRHGIAARHVSSKSHPDEPEALRETLAEAGVDLVVLAGYLKLVPKAVLEAFPRILNIHPAPLPRFGGRGMYGQRVHQAVLDAGVSHSGPTIHWVNAAYDEGAPLEHRPVPVEPADTWESLAARVLAAEHEAYWRVIRRVLERDESTPIASRAWQANDD